MSRRRAIQLGASAAAVRLLGSMPLASGRGKKSVLVAGAGIAGLCCAYELTKLGHEVTVLEAAGRTGGHIFTVRDRLMDGLYADGGAEHFTKPGYETYWRHVEEFNLPVLPYPRRNDVRRLIDGRLYTEEMLADRAVLGRLGFNSREIEYLSRQPWWNLGMLYYGPYMERFKDEYRPFDSGLGELDKTTRGELFKKDGASAAALGFIGGRGSALHALWHAAILNLRHVPLWPPQVFRLRGGNQLMTDAFAARLGERIRLGCPVTGIEQGDSAVTVRYREFGVEKKLEGDYLVCTMSLVMLRRIPATPAWPEAKDYVIRNFPYYTAARPIFQARTRFWQREGMSINLEFGEPTLQHVWSMAEEVQTSRGLVVGTAEGLTSADEALRTFRRLYPGKGDDIEQALVVDWARDPWAIACEPVSYAPGELPRFWPLVMEPHRRIHFAGAYADNLNWGMEAATRSAHRVAKAIDEA